MSEQTKQEMADTIIRLSGERDEWEQKAINVNLDACRAAYKKGVAEFEQAVVTGQQLSHPSVGIPEAKSPIFSSSYKLAAIGVPSNGPRSRNTGRWVGKNFEGAVLLPKPRGMFVATGNQFQAIGTPGH